MASKLVGSYVREDGHLINVYESGAEFDTTIGRLCKPANKNIITPETSIEYYRKRVRLKQERLLLGAAEHLAKKRGGDALPDEMDVVQAIGYSAMERATNTSKKNTKQIDAAKLIIHHGGMDEEKNEQPPARINVIVMSDDVARFLSDIRQRLGTETDISESNNRRIVDAGSSSPTSQEPTT